MEDTGFSLWSERAIEECEQGHHVRSCAPGGDDGSRRAGGEGAG